MSSDRGERKDDKEPDKYTGTGVVDAIADFIIGSGLAKKAKEALEGRSKKIDEEVDKKSKR